MYVKERIILDETVLRVASKFGTPCYIYSRQKLGAQIVKLSRIFGSHFELAISMKANPNPNLLSNELENIEWLDIASLGEMYLGQLGGVPFRKMIFIGPGKSILELQNAIQNQIGLLVVDNISEAERVSEICISLQLEMDVLIRINPDIKVNAGGQQMGGKNSQFGIDFDSAVGAIDYIDRLPKVSVRGIHIYLGTQLLDADVIYSNFKHIYESAVDIDAAVSRPLEFVDFGGGFGVSYMPHETNLDIEGLGSRVIGYLENSTKKLRKRDCRFLIESGRFVFAESGIFVCKVLYRKESKGQKYVIVDGGTNCHSMLSDKTRLLRANFPFYVVEGEARQISDSLEEEEFDVVGPLCTPTDSLLKSVKLSNVGIGDFLVFPNSGAYGLTYSNTQFLSHASLAEVLEDGEELKLIRRERDFSYFKDEYLM